MIRASFLLSLFLLLSTASLCVSFFVVDHPKDGRPSLADSSSTSALPLSQQPQQFDYEYIPPNPDAASPRGEESAYYQSLRSSYPPGIPAGMRGEAVRSALTTTERCLVWEQIITLSDLSSSNNNNKNGVLQIEGKGTRDFLHNKLTAKFVMDANNGAVALPSFQEACLLDAKGYLVDWLRVAVQADGQRAWILTSPEHSTAELLQRLDPFVFPLDQITLTNFGYSTNNNHNSDNNNAFGFSLASTQWKHVRSAMAKLRQLSATSLPDMEAPNVFPESPRDYALWTVANNVQVLVVPSVGLPSVACVGYTFVFFGSSEAMEIGKSVFQQLIDDDNLEGPIEVGPRELETLRVQAGQPAYGREYGSRRQGVTNDKNNNKIKTSPLELHWKSTLDLEKGCYLGQEGIASILKNPRGPPRQLYSVVFQDDFNLYEAQSRGDKTQVENLTYLPQPGQKLYALGSNEQLMVGTLTSVGEGGGTGDPNTVALALIKRADSIQKQMKELDLIIDRMDSGADVTLSSGIIQPPPLDPLDGLEVIVEGTFTVGTLKSIPSRRLKRDSNMFVDTIKVDGVEYRPPISTSSANVERTIPVDTTVEAESSSEDVAKQIEKAEAEAKAAAAEARRKAEKLEMLKRKAEEAMARRKQKK